MDYTSPDLEIWLSKDSKIKSLEDRCKELERKVRYLTKKKSMYKTAFIRIRNKYEKARPTKHSRAVNMVKMLMNGKIDTTLAQISRDTGLTYSTVKSIKYRLRKANEKPKTQN